MRKISILICGTSLFFSPLAIADTSIADLTNADVSIQPDLLPTAPQDKYKDFKVSGYIDGSYNNLARNYFTSGNFDRIFDLVPNGFTLQQAAMTFAYQPDHGWGFVLNPILGRDANTVAEYGFSPKSEFDSQTFAVAFPQVFIQNTQGPVTLMAGTFFSLVGYEKVNPTLDDNFSRSALFYTTPGSHTGVRGIYTINDKLSLTAGINNGWDSLRDWGLRKTVELNVSYAPSSAISLSLTGLNGEERDAFRVDLGPRGMRTLIDFVGTFQVTEKITLVANYDNGWQTTAALPYGKLGRAKWQALSGYFNYAFTKQWSSSLRAEIVEDPTGFMTGVRQNWRELTYSLGYSPLKNFEILAETRHDFSNQSAFTNKNLVNTSYGVQSYALEAYYKFG